MVARTEYCVRPAEASEVEAVGGTKNCDVGRILEIEPRVVLANREENTRRRVERLAEHLPVLLTDVSSPHEAPALWRELGELCGEADEAARRRVEVEAELAACERNRLTEPPAFIYWIWRDPWMAAGHDTYISALLTAAGWRNALPGGATRYPTVDGETLQSVDGVTFLFSTEPYAFELPRDLDAFPPAREAGNGWWRLEGGGTAAAVDGQTLSWFPSLTAEGLRAAAALRMGRIELG
jgi:ABC-type Fe3+-hydroxamate transport system substrate-binding protein